MPREQTKPLIKTKDYDHNAAYNRRLGPCVPHEVLGEYSIDYPNKIVHFTVFWQRPESDASAFLNRIVYNSRAKIGVVRKVYERIQAEVFQMKKLLIIAERQIRYLIGYKKFVRTEKVKHPDKFAKIDYYKKVNDELRHYWKYYIPLTKYYKSLPIITEKYKSLEQAIKHKDRCFECLDARLNLKQVKHRLVCENCCDNIRLTSQKMMECPICFE